MNRVTHGHFSLSFLLRPRQVENEQALVTSSTRRRNNEPVISGVCAATSSPPFEPEPFKSRRETIKKKKKRSLHWKGPAPALMTRWSAMQEIDHLYNQPAYKSQSLGHFFPLNLPLSAALFFIFTSFVDFGSGATLATNWFRLCFNSANVWPSLSLVLGVFCFALLPPRIPSRSIKFALVLSRDLGAGKSSSGPLSPVSIDCCWTGYCPKRRRY